MPRPVVITPAQLPMKEPRKPRKPKARPSPAYTAEEMRSIDAWFDMIGMVHAGVPDAWERAYARFDPPTHDERRIGGSGYPVVWYEAVS